MLFRKFRESRRHTSKISITPTGNPKRNGWMQDTYDLSKLNRMMEAAEIPIVPSEREAVTKTFPNKNYPSARWIQQKKFCKTLKRLMPICVKLFYKMKFKGTFLNSFYEEYQTTHRTSPPNENYRLIHLLIIDAKVLNKILALNPRSYKKDHPPWSSWLHPRDTGMAQHTEIHECNPPYKQS